MGRLMKALVKAQAGPGAQLQEVPVPSIGPDEVLIKVTNAAICGTDVHIYNWDPWSASRVKPPRIFGHEFCGVIEELGSAVGALEKGQFVAAEMHFACESCYYCRTGQAHICERVKIGGVDAGGCFAEYVAVPAHNVWPLPAGINPDVAAIMDPIGNAVHSALTGDLVAKRVLITGCGPIGLCCVPLAKHAGAFEVYVSDVNEYRLGLASKMGATHVLNPKTTDIASYVIEHTDGLGADVLLEMSGNPGAIRQGIKALRKGAWVSLLGIPSNPLELDLAEVIFKEIKLLGINGRRMYDTWYTMTTLLKSGLDFSPVITHYFPISKYEEAFALANSGQCGKIVFNHF